jgi:hypothetical protein
MHVSAGPQQPPMVGTGIGEQSALGGEVLAVSVKVVGAIARSLMTMLLMSAVAIAASVALMAVSPPLGALAMLAFSSFLVVRSTRQDTVLNRFTALLPGAMALLCFLLQMAVSGSGDLAWPLAGLAVGLVPGWLLGRGHRVYEKDGLLFAHKTSSYVLVWAVSYLLTQGAALFGLREIADFGLALSGFSTGMLATLSVLLLLKCRTPGGGAPRTAFTSMWIAAAFAPLLLAGASIAVIAATVGTAKEAAIVAVQESDIGGGAFRLTTNDRRIREMEGGIRQIVSSPDWGITGFQMDQGDRSTVAIVFAVHFADTAERNALYFKITGDGDWQSCGDGCMIAAYDAVGSGVLVVDHWLLFVQADRRSGGFPLSSDENRQYLRNLVWNALSKAAPRLRNIQLGGGSSGSPPQPSTPPSYTPPPAMPSPGLDGIGNALSGAGYSGDAVAAGVAAAIAQLLAGMGLAAATAAAQSAAAAAAQAAAQTAAPVPGNLDYMPSGNRVLDGARAEQWLKDNDYLDKTGAPTDKFRDFLNAPHSETAPGLQGYAGDIDDDGNPVGHYAITVPGEDEPRRTKPDDEPKKPDKPEKREEPEKPQEPKEQEPEPEKQPEKLEEPPTLTQLRDKWRAEERQLKEKIDHKRRRRMEVDRLRETLNHVYNIKRRGAVTDSAVDLLDLWMSYIVRKNSSKPGSVKGAWVKSFVKGMLKGGIRKLIAYQETGEFQTPSIVKPAKGAIGIKPGSLPDGAYKQYLQNKLQKRGAKNLGDDLGAAADLANIYKDNVDSAEKVGFLRSRVNTLDSESRELTSEINHLKDDYDVAKNAADDADKDIAAMRRQGYRV